MNAQIDTQSLVNVNTSFQEVIWSAAAAYNCLEIVRNVTTRGESMQAFTVRALR